MRYSVTFCALLVALMAHSPAQKDEQLQGGSELQKESTAELHSGAGAGAETFEPATDAELLLPENDSLATASSIAAREGVVSLPSRGWF